MTYAQAIQFLYDLRWFGAKLGLENTLKLAALAGDPHLKLRFIHVAGTNGKGSTCAMLESIYRAAGLRVGLFTSPHLVAFGERIQVNRKPISESAIVRLVTEIRELLEKGWGSTHPEDQPGSTPGSHPTFFEVVTVMALRYFVEQKCDLVIWETGLGGRLDATNIVTPLASVITNIQYDHQKWLGETLPQIAFEKAGIIKPGVPVITATDEPEALAVIQQTARDQKAPLTIITELTRLPVDGFPLALPGRHQKLNAAVAIATVRTLASIFPVDEPVVCTGLSSVQWLGRLQLITRPSGQRILLDGAHNPAGARALAAALKDLHPDRLEARTAPLSLILGILNDKDWACMCKILAPLALRILTVPVPSERTASPEELSDLCRQFNPSADITPCRSLNEALRLVENGSFVIITGSLYLVGEALNLLRLLPAGSSDERALNEWGGQPPIRDSALAAKR